jgi:hypothetical protein
MQPADERTRRGFRPPRRPGAALLVLGLHLLLVLGMWHGLAHREVDVRHATPALTWVRAIELPRSPQPSTARPPRRVEPPTPTRPAPPRTRSEAQRPAPAAALTWVSPPPVAATAAPASAPASAPPERLIDSPATRAALRDLGRQPLLSERAADATGAPIARTDTALAQAAAEAAKPDCLRDGKAASGQIGPIGVGGILGLPFLAARVVTGDCAK